MKNKLLLVAAAAAVSLQAEAQTFTHATVPVTGFSADVISDGSGTAISSAPFDVDGGNYNLVAQNYVNPSNQTPAAFLPTGGLINSAVTAGLSFQLAPYNANNSLRITTTNNTDTLVFVTPRSAHKINILATSAFGCTFTATIMFTDGTTEAFTSNVVPNWFDGTAPVAIQTIGRVKRTDNTLENPANNPRLYQYTLNLNTANTSKLIQGIKFTKTTTVATEILHIFAISASTPIPNDAGVSAITAPAATVAPGVSTPVTVTVKNYGALPLTAATLGFSVNGTTVLNNYAFTDATGLATNATAPATIGNFTFPFGLNKIKAWSMLPNGLADGLKGNDTTQVNVIACNALSGNYTIDKGSPASASNFTSFASAMQILAACGVSGPTTITLAPNSGPYTEQVIIPAISGTSATSMLTFEGNGNIVSFSPGTGNVGVFTLDGADFVKINNFNIQIPSTATSGSGIQIKNTADNNIITNNTITVPLTSTSSSVNGIITGAGGTGSGNNGSNLLIQNNTINGGYFGIAINGNSTGGTGGANNQIKNNQIKDFYYTGLGLNYTTNNLVEGNDISRPTRTNTAVSHYGIQLTNTSTGNRVNKNRIHNTLDAMTSTTGTLNGIYITGSGATGSENIISNNLIYNVNYNGGTLYGFYISSASHAYIYNNSLSADNPAVSYATLRGMYFQGTPTNVKFINNNFSLTCSATNKYGIYVTSASTGLTSDRNNIYIGSSGKYGYLGVDKVTFADWKAAASNAYDQNSVSVNPYFINTTTGNLKPLSAHLDNIGQVLAAVTEDITGVARPAVTPDPGAYEFTGSPDDAGVSAITTLATACGLTNQETVTITINNYGTSSLSNIPVSFTVNGGTPVTETFAGPLAAGANANYTFTAKADLSVPNTYTIESKTAITTDGITENNAATKVITSIPIVATYPYNQNFETSDGGWLPGGTLSTWAWGTPAKTVINSAASGTKAYITKLTGPYNANEKSQVTSPCFNFSSLTNPVFEAKIWWNLDYSWDGVVLQSSIDGGTTWQNVGAKGDPNNWFNDNTINGGPGGQPGTTAEGWTGRNSSNNGSAGWVLAKHDLTGLGGQSSVRLRFALGTDGSTQDDGFAFDDISIYEKPQADGAVTAIITPNSGCGLTNSETVTISVKNFGTATLNSIPVAFKVDGVASVPVPEIMTGPLAPGATANYTFTAKANLGTVGTHRIKAFSIVPGDILAANDTTERIVTTIPVISTLPYTEGFESGDGGWLAGGANSSWVIGTPAKPVINSAGAGTKSYVTGLTANYNINEQSYVESPCFDFTKNAQPVFEAKIWWQSENNFDGTVLQSSIDGGITWQNVGAYGDPNNWYNNNTIGSGPGGQPASTAQGWTGRVIGGNGSGGWLTAKHVLNGLGGKPNVKLRFAFGSNAVGQDDGFAFDAINITDLGKNMAVNSVVPFTKICGLGAAEQITAVIQNQSSIPLTGFTVSYSINGGTPVTETYTGTLAPVATQNYTFTQTANLSATGPQNILVTVTMNGDLDASNNSITYSFTNTSFASIPPVLNFEPAGVGLSQLVKVTNTKSAVIEATAASLGTGSTKGMLMDAVANSGWTIPSASQDPWTMNPDHFSGIYFCFNPAGGNPTDPLWLSFDLKQLFKTAAANTNFRVTVNGTAVGGNTASAPANTYRPPFNGIGGTTDWTKIYLDLSSYKSLSNIRIGLEGSVAEPYANGAGTANMVDNVRVQRLDPTGVNSEILASQLHIFPNPSAGNFLVSLPKGKTYQLEVTDLTGKLILSQEAKSETQLNLETAAKGIYLLKISGENGTAVRKLVVQ